MARNQTIGKFFGGKEDVAAPPDKPGSLKGKLAAGMAAAVADSQPAPPAVAAGSSSSSRQLDSDMVEADPKAVMQAAQRAADEHAVAAEKKLPEKKHTASPPKHAQSTHGDSDDDGPVRKKKRAAIAPSDTSDDEAPSPPPPPKKKAAPVAAPKASSSKLPAQSAGKQTAPEVIDVDEAESSAPEHDAEVEEDDSEEELVAEEEQKSHKKIAAIFLKPEASQNTKVKWEAGKPVPYAALSHAFVEIEATTKRLIILEILTKLFVRIIELSPSNLLPAVYLCINRLCPDYEGLELGIGEGILLKAIAQGTGRDMKTVKKDLEAKGDLGLVAIGSRQKQPTMFKAPALTVPAVFKQLKEIAAMTGSKSQERKMGGIKKLLAASVDEEPKYIMRSLEGKLRIGLAERTVLVALAQSIVITGAKKGKRLSPEAMSEEIARGTEVLKAVFSEIPNYDMVVPALLESGIDGCRQKCKLTPGIPLKPMLAKPTKAITEVLDRFEDKAFTCEYKYDGERAQVHYFVPAGAQAGSKAQLAVFSRNSENMSLKYPDLVEQVPRCIHADVQSFVFDAEVTAWKKAEPQADGSVLAARLLPFQELSRRKRKDVKAEDITVKVKLFAFDLLYLNGQPLLHMDLAERRKLLHASFHAVPDEFDFATSQDCTTTEEIQAFLDVSVQSGCEGLMVKMLQGREATYEPSRRSLNWLKLKKDYLAGTGDSLDLVVIGGYYGKGKRTNVYGAFLLACYDADSESYQSVCKIGTGFTEEMLEVHYNTLKPLELQSKKAYYDVGEAKPDVYFESRVVWEVLTADLSLSPVYTAAKGMCDAKRGISLRFPRFLRIRDDKDPDDSTAPEQIASMYRAQATTNKGGKKGGDEDDFW